jgi:hypothetical protein
MLKHQVQEDGNVRDADNWQIGIPKSSYIDSLIRHLVDVWGIHRGHWAISDNGEDIENLLCACMFNCMGMLHEILKEGISNDENISKPSN